jgi:hypothetical protein
VGASQSVETWVSPLLLVKRPATKSGGQFNEPRCALSAEVIAGHIFIVQNTQRITVPTLSGEQEPAVTFGDIAHVSVVNCERVGRPKIAGMRIIDCGLQFHRAHYHPVVASDSNGLIGGTRAYNYDAGRENQTAGH